MESLKLGTAYPRNNVSASNSTNTLQSGLTQSTTSPELKSSLNFENELKQYLAPDAEGKINEEDLFASLINFNLKNSKSVKASNTFQEAFLRQKLEHELTNGYIPIEDAAKSALKDVINSGAISKEEGDSIFSQSFQGAQLDSNSDSLYDSRGGENDATVAAEILDTALQKSKQAVADLASGTITLQARSLLDEASSGQFSSSNASSFSGTDTTSSAASESSASFTASSQDISNGATEANPYNFETFTADDLPPLPGEKNSKKTESNNSSVTSAQNSSNDSATSSTKVYTIDGPKGFEFSPASNASQRLTITLPETVTGNISQLLIKDQDGKTLEEKKTSDTQLEGRESYTLKQQGSLYPKNIIVEVQLKSGEIQSYVIEDPGKEYD
jgi:hypothetical protein